MIARRNGANTNSSHAAYPAFAGGETVVLTVMPGYQEPVGSRARPSNKMTEMRMAMPGRRPALRHWRPVTLVSMTLILASCAGHPGPGPGPAAPAPGKTAGQLRITQVDVGRANPTEGARSYIRVERATGATLLTRTLPGGQELMVRLNPGAYRLVSWQRTCDGNCGTLDPVSDRCARPFTIKPHQKLEATIRVDFASGCVMTVR